VLARADAIVEGLAQRIVSGSVPPQLLDKKILAQENYQKAKETYGILLVVGVNLDPLPLYRKIVKGEIEKEILSWPDVTTKKMYGCPCYQNKEKLFAFLVTDGVVLTKTSEQDKMKLSKEFEIKPFQAATRTMRGRISK
jgi:hypothetical protein